jgi:hypothetical protein
MADESNLDKMKASLSGRAAGASTTSSATSNSELEKDSTSPQEYFPARMRGIRWRRKSGFGAAVGRSFGIFLLVFLALFGFCCVDLSQYQQWVAATEILPDLRKAAGDQVRGAELVKLAIAVDREHVALKSGLLGVIALRKVGLGERDAGIHNCKQICEQFPTSWFASQFSENSLYTSCSACVAKGALLKPCYHCKGSGICSRCGGSGECSFFMGNTRPSGSGGGIRNTGQFRGMGEKCLECKGAKKCRSCSGKGKLKGSCAECDGVGSHFSQQKVIERYRGVIDYVIGLHPSWVATIVRLQSFVKTVMPGF